MVANRHWTKAEKDVLKKHYSAINGHEISKALPGRSYSSVRSQARQMGLKKCHDRMREMGRENRAKADLPKPMPTVAPPQAA